MKITTNRSRILTLAAAACIASSMWVNAQPKSLAQSGLDKAYLEQYLRYSELWIPQVTVKIDDPKPSTALKDYFDVTVHLIYNGATKDEAYFVSKDGRNIVKGTAYDITRSPFQSNIDSLKTDKQPAFGAPAGAPVTLAVFGDFQCPVCQREEQDLRKNIPATFGDKVRVYFYDFPLTSIHPWAMKGSIAARCMYRNNEKAFWDYHDWIYQKQGEITLENLDAKVADFSKENKLDVNACMADKSAAAEVEKSMALGHELQVSATPTLFINGRKLEGALQWEVLSQLLQIELDHKAAEPKTVAVAPAAAKEDDKCCVVEIPTIKAKK